MGEIFRRVSAGEEIVVTYRDATKIKLGLDGPQKRRGQGGTPGIDAYLAAPKKKPSPFDPNMSFKEQYHELLMEKYGKYVK